MTSTTAPLTLDELAEHVARRTLSYEEKLAATPDPLAYIAADVARARRLVAEAVYAYLAARGWRVGDRVRLFDHLATAGSPDGVITAIGPVNAHVAIAGAGAATFPLDAPLESVHPNPMWAELVEEALNLAAAGDAAAIADVPELPADLAAMAAPETQAEGRLYVVPCGDRKGFGLLPAGTRLPAADAYTGPLFRSALAAARRLADQPGDRIVILSARYGWLDLADPVADYNVRITNSDAIGTDELVGQAAALGLLDYPAASVVVLGGRDYVTATARVWGRRVEAPLAGCAGLGYMRGRLARMGLDEPAGDDAIAEAHAYHDGPAHLHPTCPLCAPVERPGGDEVLAPVDLGLEELVADTCRRCGGVARLTSAGWRHGWPPNGHDGHCPGTGLWPDVAPRQATPPDLLPLIEAGAHVRGTIAGVPVDFRIAELLAVEAGSVEVLAARPDVGPRTLYVIPRRSATLAIEAAR